MTYNPKTKRKHGAGTLAGPKMQEINAEWKKHNLEAEQERIARQRKIAERKQLYAAQRGRS